MEPESAPISSESGALSGEADVLTWESTADDVDSLVDVGSLERGDVFEDGHSGPVLCEDSPAERVDLAEGDSSHPGALEAEAEPADSGEEVEDIHANSICILIC